MSKRTLLYSGHTGGKSTFLGGLCVHLQSDDESTVAYRELDGNTSVFERTIRSPMVDEHRYPRNMDPLRMRFTLERESKSATELTMVSVPIRLMGPLENHWPWKAECDRETIERQYEDIRGEDGDFDSAWSDDSETVLAHEYHQSDTVIFLLNLSKVIRVTDAIEFDMTDVRQAAAEKDVAVVATATDLVDYEPNEDVADDGGLLEYIFGSGEPVDSALLDELFDKLSVATSIQAKEILRAAKAESDVAFFGVAVPCRDPVDDARSIATEDGTIETWGFENVVRWLE